MELDDYITPLVPVSEWPWQLFRITWYNKLTDTRRIMWVVSTDDQVHSDCQDRWPSDYWDQVHWEAVASVNEPPRRPSQYGVAHVDVWAHGQREATRLGL
jgi:hypothetical protein